MDHFFRRAGARLTHTLRRGAVRLVRAVLRRPQLKLLLRAMLARFPALQGRLQALMYRAAMAPHAQWAQQRQDDADLSPRTLRMVRALKRAIEEEQR